MLNNSVIPLVLGLILFLMSLKPLLTKKKDWRAEVGLEDEG